MREERCNSDTVIAIIGSLNISFITLKCLSYQHLIVSFVALIIYFNTIKRCILAIKRTNYITFTDALNQSPHIFKNSDFVRRLMGREVNEALKWIILSTLVSGISIIIGIQNSIVRPTITLNVINFIFILIGFKIKLNTVKILKKVISN